MKEDEIDTMIIIPPRQRKGKARKKEGLSKNGIYAIMPLMKKASGSLILLLTALIWGAAFVAQRTGMDHVGPYTFQVARGLLGFLALVPVMLWQKKSQGADFRTPSLKGCLLCGVILTLASTTQQIGLVSTSASKAGFIGALYVVFVPLIGLPLGMRAGRKIWLSVLLAVVGMFLISGVGLSQMNVQVGDIWLLISAVFYAVHILAVARFAPGVNGATLSAAQFLVMAVLMLLPALILEKPTLSGILDAKWAILYTGVLSGGVGYTLQIVGQKYVPSTIASLILSLESVFSLVAGMLLLGERLRGAEWAGCALVLLAVMVSQLPEKRR